jgi:Mn2+/Fe2+ NRAMP family transporter
VFYGTFAFVVAAACAVVLVPGMPLVPLLYLSQALNAVLLLPLLWLMRIVGRDPDLMGRHRLGRAGSAATLLAIALLTVCLAALAALELA